MRRTPLNCPYSALEEKEKNMHSVEATGKNVEQAINNALLELKAPREDVDIEILSMGGFLKKAKVKVSISADAIDKYEKKEELKKTIQEEKLEEKKAEQDKFVEDFLKKKAEITEEKPQKEERKQKVFVDEEYVAPQKKEEKQEAAEVIAKLSAEEFLQGVLKSLNLEGNIEKTEDDRYVYFNLTGENLNDLIGYHGDCMLALSQFMNIACRRENRKKFVLDIEGYREKRAESLRELAKRTANKVAKTGRYFKFEPMDPSERKIIHTALQEDDRVTTLSKGEEPHRYLIVFPKEYRE